MHPEFETEWWYFTGHLFTEGKVAFKDAPPYGFQLTFFRKAIDPTESSSKLPSWTQIFLAHGALSDHVNNSFHYDHRLSRGALGVAGAKTEGLSVWNRDWRAQMIGESILLEYGLEPSHGPGSKGQKSSPLQIKLIATPQGLPVLHGQGGYSAKAACDGCASHYYSFPGMRLTGTVFSGGTEQQVSGLGWMDHEFMTNALTASQVGWDWFSLTHQDGRHFMLFFLRRKDGSIDFASGTVMKGNESRPLQRGDFEVEVLDHWQSQQSGGRYPARWKVSIPNEKIDVELTPLSAAQELYLPLSSLAQSTPSQIEARDEVKALAYWEGAVASSDKQVIGYVEMTGYAGSVKEFMQ